MLIHTAAPETCAGPDEAAMQGRARLGAVLQPASMPHQRGMETSSSSAVREVNDRRGVAALDEMCTCEVGVQNSKTCILSIFAGWCSVLLLRSEQLIGTRHCPAKMPLVAPLNGTGLGLQLLRKQSNAGRDCPVNFT